MRLNEVIDDRPAVDQRFSIIQNQGWDPAYRIVFKDVGQVVGG